VCQPFISLTSQTISLSNAGPRASDSYERLGLVVVFYVVVVVEEQLVFNVILQITVQLTFLC